MKMYVTLAMFSILSFASLSANACTLLCGCRPCKNDLLNINSNINKSEYQIFENDEFTLSESGTHSYNEDGEDKDCELLISSLENKLRIEANQKCRSLAIQTTSGNYECFRPTMNRNPLNYIFGEMTLSFKCKNN